MFTAPTMHPFLDQALEVLRLKASACVRGSEEARIDFLAHLFVICTFLQEAESSAAMRKAPAPHPARRAPTWADVPGAMQSVPVDQPEIAYERPMPRAMRTWERWRQGGGARWGGPPPARRLEAERAGGCGSFVRGHS